MNHTGLCCVIDYTRDDFARSIEGLKQTQRNTMNTLPMVEMADFAAIAGFHAKDCRKATQRIATGWTTSNLYVKRIGNTIRYVTLGLKVHKITVD